MYSISSGTGGCAIMSYFVRFTKCVRPCSAISPNSKGYIYVIVFYKMHSQIFISQMFARIYYVESLGSAILTVDVTIDASSGGISVLGLTKLALTSN